MTRDETLQKTAALALRVLRKCDAERQPSEHLVALLSVVLQEMGATTAEDVQTLSESLQTLTDRVNLLQTVAETSKGARFRGI